MNGISLSFHFFILASLILFLPGCGDDSVSPPADDDTPGTRTWFVNMTAQGTGTGTSWANAFIHPQQAVDAAAPGDTVWVAHGLYASRAPGNPAIPVVALEEGICMYAGFDPLDTSFADRDPVTNPTVLDGNDETYHVVVGAANAVLDGFAITGGYANGAEPHNVGGGMLNDGASAIVTNCTFMGNRSEWHGGGIFNRNCAAEIAYCAFTENTAANNGGAIYNDGGGGGIHPVIRGCTFQNNRDSRFGGAVFNHSCPAEITGCVFSGNYANHNGGGIYNDNSEAGITHCIFTGNLSTNGGAVYVMATATNRSPVIANCLFDGNEALYSAGALYILNAAPAVTNCTFSNNTARDGGAIASWNGATTITNCIAWADSAMFEDDEILVGGTILPIVSFSDVDQEGFGVDPAGTTDANNNIRMDPLFAAGPLGVFYLGHASAGEPFTSPCVDAGSGTALALGLDDRTTRTDGEPDAGTVNMGYHYDIGIFGSGYRSYSVRSDNIHR